MKKILLAVLILSLTACAGTMYKNGGSYTKSEYDRDWYDCQSKNRTASPAMALVDLQNAFDCMKYEHGYARGD